MYIIFRQYFVSRMQVYNMTEVAHAAGTSIEAEWGPSV